MELGLALEGGLQEFEDDLVKGVREASRDGVGAVGRFGVGQSRKVSQALGPVGMAWGYTLYPESKTALSDDPAVVIHPRGETAEKIFTSHSRGERIFANGAINLWLPIKGSPADRPKPRRESLVRFMMRTVGRENIRIIPATASRPAMAIARDASITKTGRVGKGGRSRLRSGGFRKGTADVPLFYLVPDIQLDRAVDLERAFAETERAAPGLIHRTFQERLGQPS